MVEEVSVLLDQLVPNPTARVWHLLWDHLCHQGTVCSDSFAALPKLTAAAASWPPADRIMVLSPAGTIVAGANETREDEHLVRKQYSKEIATLLNLVNECLDDTPAVLDGGDSTAFIYLLGAQLAFEGISPWDAKLPHGLANGEYEVECPTCEASLFISLSEEYGFVAAHDDYALRKAGRTTSLRPARPSDLNGLAHRLYATVSDAGHGAVATQVLHLFGKGVCTECAAVFAVADQVVMG